MAMRRDPRKGQETPPRQDEEKVVEFPKPGTASGIRPEMMVIVDQILEEDRPLFERLAAYDRGEGR